MAYKGAVGKLMGMHKNSVREHKAHEHSYECGDCKSCESVFPLHFRRQNYKKFSDYAVSPDWLNSVLRLPRLESTPVASYGMKTVFESGPAVMSRSVSIYFMASM